MIPHQDKHKLLDRAAEVLGTADFNHLIRSVGETRQKGRLRYWQERRLLTLARETGFSISSVDDFAALFDGAELRPVPRPALPMLTKAEYLAALEDRRFPAHGGKIPPDWMREAWKIDWFREHFTGEMSRTVSKIGELSYDAEYLHFLDQSLSVPQLVELYCRIRDDSPAREVEFRPGFESAFPSCVATLPPPLSKWDLVKLVGVHHARDMGIIDPDESPLDDDAG